MMVYNLWIVLVVVNKGGGWIRLFGSGYGVSYSKRNYLLASETLGFAKYVRIGRWVIHCLKPKKGM